MNETLVPLCPKGGRNDGVNGNRVGETCVAEGRNV